MQPAENASNHAVNPDGVDLQGIAAFEPLRNQFRSRRLLSRPFRAETYFGSHSRGFHPRLFTVCPFGAGSRRRSSVKMGDGDIKTRFRRLSPGVARHSPQGSGGAASRPVFDCWHDVLNRIRKARHILLLLDFDGTLVPFQKNPKDVRLDQGTRALLKRLSRRRKISLNFISGRRRGDLRRRVGVEQATYWGLHGWEGPAGARLSLSSRRELKRMHRQMHPLLSGLPGVRLQDKGAGLALHYRGAPRLAAAKARAVATKVLTPLQPGFRILRGKKIWEVLPPEVQGKGAAVRRLTACAPAGTLAIYIGDDTTDEAAFAELPKALTIRVGQRARTHARFLLRSPHEVQQFLDRLESEGLKMSGASFRGSG